MNSKLSVPLRNASFEKTFLFLYFFRFKTTFYFIRHDSSFIQIVPGRAGGGSFRGKKTINQRKNLPIECAQGDQPVRCPNRAFFCVHQPSAVPSGGGVLVAASCVPVVCRWW